ncbi:MAG: heavy metal-binding domain-containing protein [Candidatus Dormibacteria bacterium]
MTQQQPQIAADASRRLKAGIFTSDLSVDELYCLESMGFDPLGFVMGTSIYHVGIQFAMPKDNIELTVISGAMYQARTLAMGRMEEEAAILEADGIVGVRFVVKFYDFGPDLLEFMAMGTAVRARDPQHSLRLPSGKPFTSDLSGEDFLKLRQAGYRPLHMSMGNCVYHVARQSLGGFINKLGRNAEMENFTQGMYEARELAMGRMEYEAQQVGAKGIVGVKLEEKSFAWGSHVIEFFAVGTSVIREEGAPTPAVPGVVIPIQG